MLGLDKGFLDRIVEYLFFVGIIWMIWIFLGGRYMCFWYDIGKFWEIFCYIIVMDYKYCFFLNICLLLVVLVFRIYGCMMVGN